MSRIETTMSLSDHPLRNIADSVHDFSTLRRLQRHCGDQSSTTARGESTESSARLSVGERQPKTADAAQSHQDVDLPLLSSKALDNSHGETAGSLLAWWLPELASAAMSTALLISTVIVLKVYDGQQATGLRLPRFLTLNGLIAILATLNRAFLTAPVCSAMAQEMWLFFANESDKKVSSCQGSLVDVELYFDASTGIGAVSCS